MTETVKLLEGTMLATEITDLVFVGTTPFRAGGWVNSERIVMPARPGARIVFVVPLVQSGGVLVDVVASSLLLQAIQVDLDFGGKEWRYLADTDVSLEAFVSQFGFSDFGLDVSDFGTG